MRLLSLVSDLKRRKSTEQQECSGAPATLKMRLCGRKSGILTGSVAYQSATQCAYATVMSNEWTSRRSDPQHLTGVLGSAALGQVNR